MMFFSTVEGSIIDNFRQRLIKVLRMGKSDIQTPNECSPSGYDGNPVKDMVAVYAETSSRGENVIVGYLNVNRLADVGETRLYSTDAEGNPQTFVWLKNDGTIILGGDSDNLIKYSPLENELNNFVQFINQQLSLISAGISSAGGSYTPGNASIDISSAKTEKIKIA